MRTAGDVAAVINTASTQDDVVARHAYAVREFIDLAAEKGLITDVQRIRLIESVDQTERSAAMAAFRTLSFNENDKPKACSQQMARLDSFSSENSSTLSDVQLLETLSRFSTANSAHSHHSCTDEGCSDQLPLSCGSLTMTITNDGAANKFSLAPLADGSGRRFAANELWMEQPVLFILLRRLGCVLCRCGAKRLWSMRGVVMSYGVRVVAVVHEWFPQEVEEFREFWGGELYLDVSKALYQAVGGGQVLRGTLQPLMNPFGPVWRRYREAKKYTASSSNLVGDPLLMGGMLLVGMGNGKILHAFREESYGKYPTEQQVVEACQRLARQM